MTPDDPRHGKNSGYVAGCREGCCRVARTRAAKRRALRLLAGEKFYREENELAELMAPWDTEGVGRSVIAAAAGLSHKHVFAGPVLASTYDALAGVTEDDLPAGTWIYADLTRRRVFSLLAAGHPLSAMPVLTTGRWRYSLHCSVDLARQVRATFRRLEMEIGTSKHTASRARNAGHLPPLAWDDPDTLAWPLGWTEPLDVDSIDIQEGYIRNAEKGDTLIDQNVVERVLSGRLVPDASPAERLEVARRWPGSLAELERMTGWNVHRERRRCRSSMVLSAPTTETEEDVA